MQRRSDRQGGKQAGLLGGRLGWPGEQSLMATLQGGVCVCAVCACVCVPPSATDPGCWSGSATGGERTADSRPAPTSRSWGTRRCATGSRVSAGCSSVWHDLQYWTRPEGGRGGGDVHSLRAAGNGPIPLTWWPALARSCRAGTTTRPAGPCTGWQPPRPPRRATRTAQPVQPTRPGGRRTHSGARVQPAGWRGASGPWRQRAAPQAGRRGHRRVKQKKPASSERWCRPWPTGNGYQGWGNGGPAVCCGPLVT